VADATKISAVTLRKWEQDFARLGFDSSTAEGAGRLKVVLEDNPAFAENDGNSIDARQLALLKELQEKPLATFGQEYVARFGHRHNQ
jgi:hypothetical protein